MPAHVHRPDLLHFEHPPGLAIQAQGQSGSNQKSATTLAPSRSVTTVSLIHVNRHHATPRVQPSTPTLRTDGSFVGFRNARCGLPMRGSNHQSALPMRKEPCSKVPGTNLTREEAAERARLVSVSSYEVELDLTTGSETFASTSVVRFSAEPGSTTFVDLVATAVERDRPQRPALDPAAVFADSRIALADLAAENELRVGRRLRVHPHRRGTAPFRRPGRRRRVPLHAVRGA